jgi:amino acid transporter/nucleotide-binding universal stress UspA family protein
MIGPGLLLVFLLNGFVALLTAMAYAELGSAYHDAGGGYRWIKSSLPQPFGFLSGWMSWFAQAVACSLYALGFGAYFSLVLDSFGVPELHVAFMTLEKWLAVLVCLLLSYINFRGASEAGKAGTVVTVGKVAVIGLFIGMGLWVMARTTGWEANFEPFMPAGWMGILGAMGLTFIAFEGYEIIAQTSEEVEEPRKNVPRAVFLSLLIVIPIYLLVAFVAVGAVIAPQGMSVTEYLGQEKEIALVTAASQFLRGGGIVILVGGLLSTLSALNATLFSSSRLAFSMARDANLPEFLGRVHKLRATPHLAILASALIVITMAISLPIEDVAAAADIMFLLLFAQVNLALIRLRKLRPDLDRGFRVPLVPLIPIISIVSMLFLTVILLIQYPNALWATVGWIAAGAVVYYTYTRKSEQVFTEREEWMERLERKEYRVLVAISSPRTLDALMETGIAIARQHGGELLVLTVAEVPEGDKLMSGRRLARKLDPLLERAMDYAKKREIKAYPVVKISRRVSHGIVETAREEECNFLVIGRPQTHSVFERIVASVVERVLQHAPCQVGIVSGNIRPHEIKRIVVPVSGGENAELAAELAPAFARWFSAPIRTITVIESGTDEEEARKLVEGATGTLKHAGLDEDQLEILKRRDVAKGLTGAMRTGDLFLVGAPLEESAAAFLGVTIPAALAESQRAPVVVVRDVQEKQARRAGRVFFGRR